jgi:malate dehydrogenase
MRNKVSIVGAGNVGAATAQRILEYRQADVVLVDIVEGLAAGKALDLAEAAPIAGYDTQIRGATGYMETAGSDGVVITSCLARLPGMSRDDLLAKNPEIVGSVVEQAVARSPDAILAETAHALLASRWQPCPRPTDRPAVGGKETKVR